VGQVGDGELTGLDVKRLIGASNVGTPYETSSEGPFYWQYHQLLTPHYFLFC
jgi:hypothetical protein